MGIFSALSTAVAGLRAQSFAIENISGNIANSQTTGFKRVDTAFVDLIPDAPAQRQLAGSVFGISRGTNGVQGDIRDSQINTHMAINGTGLFVIDEQVGVTDGRPVFSGVDKYTRRGDFAMDRFGYLRNGSGYFLKGFPVDPITGNASGSVPEVIRITTDFQPARETTQVNYRANLSALPRPANFRADTPGSELMPAALISTDANGDMINANNAPNFINSSIEGGGVTVYDAQGSPVNVQLRWGKVTSTPGNEQWRLFYLENSQATGTNAAWRAVPQTYTFNAQGQLTPAVTSVNLPNLTIDGRQIGNVILNHGQGGLTQFTDPNGNAQITQLDQNGYPAGELASVSVSDGGVVIGTYTNGRTQPLARVALASFNGIESLRRIDGGAFQATQESGVAILGASGSISGGALEGSNVDIADEFTRLIVTQQAYTANTRIVSTSDEMMREALNMIR